MTTQKTQLLVLGGGPGGYAAAFRAADLGIAVTLVDTEPNPGGVCLYKGCIPSKALLHIAKVISEAKETESFGVKFGSPQIDLETLRQWKSSVVSKLTTGLGQLAKQRKVTFIQGRGNFVKPQKVRVIASDGSEVIIEFEQCIIATGSYPIQLPNWPIESKRLWNSTSALELREIPKSLLVIGGGYIGLELGSVYAALGSEVTVVEMADNFIPGADTDLVNPLRKRLEGQFHKVLLKTKVLSLKDLGHGMEVELEGPEGTLKQVYDVVLGSIGRKPNTSGLGLKEVHVDLNTKGFIVVNNQRKTSSPNIFAIGDVAGDPMLAHKATHEGCVAAEVIAGHNVFFDPQAIPAVVFTDPEVAWCGLTETQAKKEGRSVSIVRFPWAANGRSLTLGRSEGVTKLIVDSQTERILGVGLCGPGAGDMISEGVLAIEFGAIAKDLALTIHPHPTLSETVMECAEVFYNKSVHLYRPARK